MIKRWTLVACAILGPLISPAISFAEDTLDLNTKLGNIGCSEQSMISVKIATALISCNVDDALNLFTKLQDHGLLSPNITYDEATRQKYSYTFDILLMALLVTVSQTLRDNKSIESFYGISSLQDKDKFGNDDEHPAVTFYFDRYTYNKINWKGFTPENLPRVAPDWKLSLWMLAALSAEKKKSN
jgi:hypothetical protein